MYRADWITIILIIDWVMVSVALIPSATAKYQLNVALQLQLQ